MKIENKLVLRSGSSVGSRNPIGGNKRLGWVVTRPQYGPRYVCSTYATYTLNTGILVWLYNMSLLPFIQIHVGLHDILHIYTLFIQVYINEYIFAFVFVDTCILAQEIHCKMWARDSQVDKLSISKVKLTNQAYLYVYIICYMLNLPTKLILINYKLNNLNLLIHCTEWSINVLANPRKLKVFVINKIVPARISAAQGHQVWDLGQEVPVLPRKPRRVRRAEKDAETFCGGQRHPQLLRPHQLCGGVHGDRRHIRRCQRPWSVSFVFKLVWVTLCNFANLVRWRRKCLVARVGLWRGVWKADSEWDEPFLHSEVHKSKFFSFIWVMLPKSKVHILYISLGPRITLFVPLFVGLQLDFQFYR